MIYHNAVEVTRILLYKLNGIFMCGSRWGLGKPLKFHAAVYEGGGCLQTVYDDIQYIPKILSWKGPTFPENNRYILVICTSTHCILHAYTVLLNFMQRFKRICSNKDCLLRYLMHSRNPKFKRVEISKRNEIRNPGNMHIYTLCFKYIYAYTGSFINFCAAV